MPPTAAQCRATHTGALVTMALDLMAIDPPALADRLRVLRHLRAARQIVAPNKRVSPRTGGAARRRAARNGARVGTVTGQSNRLTIVYPE